MSKKLLLVFVASLFCTTANADKIDCDSLTTISGALDQVIIGLADGAEVDDELYQGLSDTMDALHTIADQEDNASLDQGLNDLEAAFKDDSRDEFIVALNEVNTAFDRFIQTDCK